MPLIKIQKSNKQSGWGLWFISESEQELLNLVHDELDTSIINPYKKREWLAGRALLKELVSQAGIEYQGTLKNEFGKPFLKGLNHHISLSHSFPYVAAQIDDMREVGIDIEQPKPKLFNIAHRIMKPEELSDAGEDMVKHCIYWCAKEAMYKIYGKRGLHFSSQLIVENFKLTNSGMLHGTIIANNTEQVVQLRYLVQPDYVLVFTQT